MSFLPKRPAVMSAARPVDHFKKFAAEMRADPRLAGSAAAVADVLKAMESESYDVEDGATCLCAIECIMLQDLTIDQKLHHINRLLALDKVENLNLAEFIRVQ